MDFLKPKFHLGRKFGPHGSGEKLIVDEAELQRHQELESLYTSTRAAKHFQKDIVKGVEGFMSLGKKQSDVANKLAEECKKYGTEGPRVKESLSRATLQYGTARNKMEKEREHMHRVLFTQVAEPLKVMVSGAPLEDARHLKQKYDRLRQEADSQGTEVKRRTKEAGENPDNVAKLQAAKQKMEEITSAMEILGNSATSAMTDVESQQQITTLQRMLAMVDAERSYFQRATNILDQLHFEIESEVKRVSSSGQGSHNASINSSITTRTSPDRPDSSKSVANGGSKGVSNGGYVSHDELIPSAVDNKSFYAEATLDFIGEDEGELSLSVGDEVLVRQVTESGWSEGDCNGRSGWFPSAYVVRKNLARKGRGSGH